MIVLLGIDDTDNAASRGTGYHARRLGSTISDHGLAEFRAVTRHQLLIDPRINYTSRNSSACIVLEASEGSIPEIAALALTELQSRCATDSSGGMCIAPEDSVDQSIEGFGVSAKRHVVSEKNAHKIAQTHDLILERLIGAGTGIVGALASVGLHKSGCDGRFIWLPGLREASGAYTVGELKDRLQVEIATSAGDNPPSEVSIEVREWVRPVLRDGRPVLLVEEERENGEIGWHLVGKPTVRSLSD